MRPRRLRELVLVGGGHAHVQVLQRFIMKPDPDVRVTTVLDQPLALYSGMVPGVLAGDYQPWEAEIDVWALARRANARIVDAAATGLAAGLSAALSGFAAGFSADLSAGLSTALSAAGLSAGLSAGVSAGASSDPPPPRTPT